MNIGIIGAGKIAGVLADTMNKMEEATPYAIASRDLKRAEDFAKKYGVSKAYGSYEEMLKDEEVELVYIATPHSHHYEHMKMCIEHRKAILCEKAFTFNADEAKEIKKLAAENKVYVAEAIWTRYMPARQAVDEVIKSNIIGKISMVTCSLAYNIGEVERIIRPELAGGALLDLGVYGLNFIIMHFGKDIERVKASVVKAETGVDAKESITVIYKNGLMAVTNHCIYGRADNKGIFYGEKGYIVVENINNPRAIEIYDSSDKMIEHINLPKRINGYEYEISESIKCIKEGKTESISMPLDESVYIMELMDEIKKKF